MHPRIVLARFLQRLGRFISSLDLIVMRPDDLVELSRQLYAGNNQVKHWGSEDTIDRGLTTLEKAVLEKINLTQGKVLVLGLGGGREAIALAKMGFAVTGVDFIPELVALAKENAAKHGVHLDAQVGEFSCLATPPATFDLILLSDRMYSSIPTRGRRIKMLKKMNKALRPGGWFACMFLWNSVLPFSPLVDRLRKLFAYLSLGNLWYEPGDVVLYGEFVHQFRDESEPNSEFAEGGFELIHPCIINEKEHSGMALLHKAN